LFRCQPKEYGRRRKLKRFGFIVAAMLTLQLAAQLISVVAVLTFSGETFSSGQSVSDFSIFSCFAVWLA